MSHTQYDWFVGTMPNSDAEACLKDSNEGEFLVRESENQRGAFVIQVRSNTNTKGIRAWRIKQATHADGYGCYFIEQGANFPSVETLVNNAKRRGIAGVKLTKTCVALQGRNVLDSVGERERLKAKGVGTPPTRRSIGTPPVSRISSTPPASSSPTTRRVSTPITGSPSTGFATEKAKRPSAPAKIPNPKHDYEDFDPTQFAMKPPTPKANTPVKVTEGGRTYQNVVLQSGEVGGVTDYTGEEYFEEGDDEAESAYQNWTPGGGPGPVVVAREPDEEYNVMDHFAFVQGSAVSEKSNNNTRSKHDSMVDDATHQPRGLQITTERRRNSGSIKLSTSTIAESTDASPATDVGAPVPPPPPPPAGGMNMMPVSNPTPASPLSGLDLSSVRLKTASVEDKKTSPAKPANPMMNELMAKLRKRSGDESDSSDENTVSAQPVTNNSLKDLEAAWTPGEDYDTSAGSVDAKSVAQDPNAPSLPPPRKPSVSNVSVTVKENPDMYENTKLKDDETGGSETLNGWAPGEDYDVSAGSIETSGASATSEQDPSAPGLPPPRKPSSGSVTVTVKPNADMYENTKLEPQTQKGPSEDDTFYGPVPTQHSGPVEPQHSTQSYENTEIERSNSDARGRLGVILFFIVNICWQVQPQHRERPLMMRNTKGIQKSENLFLIAVHEKRPLHHNQEHSKLKTKRRFRKVSDAATATKFQKRGTSILVMEYGTVLSAGLLLTLLQPLLNLNQWSNPKHQHQHRPPSLPLLWRITIMVVVLNVVQNSGEVAH
eukprot:m.89674 g.89674  ORF g.89674 m.89674 type:complete len:773 (+) comp13234_c0_seq4:356-2674(+)